MRKTTAPILVVAGLFGLVLGACGDQLDDTGHVRVFIEGTNALTEFELPPDTYDFVMAGTNVASNPSITITVYKTGTTTPVIAESAFNLTVVAAGNPPNGATLTGTAVNVAVTSGAQTTVTIPGTWSSIETANLGGANTGATFTVNGTPTIQNWTTTPDPPVLKGTTIAIKVNASDTETAVGGLSVMARFFLSGVGQGTAQQLNYNVAAGSYINNSVAVPGTAGAYDLRITVSDSSGGARTSTKPFQVN